MSTVLDFRHIEPRARHALFLSVFEGLREGTSFEFINDHDPVPLYRQVQLMNIPNLSWNYSEKGPEIWKVQVTKGVSDELHEENCSGTCGGEKHLK